MTDQDSCDRDRATIAELRRIQELASDVDTALRDKFLFDVFEVCQNAVEAIERRMSQALAKSMDLVVSKEACAQHGLPLVWSQNGNDWVCVECLTDESESA